MSLVGELGDRIYYKSAKNVTLVGELGDRWCETNGQIPATTNDEQTIPAGSKACTSPKACGY